MTNTNVETLTENVLSESVYEFINHIAESNSELFGLLKKSINGNNHAEKFIRCVIGDFVYDINEKYQDDRPDIFLKVINEDWGGDYKGYCKELVYSMQNARTIISNIYFMYVDNKKEIDQIEIDEISDISADFYLADEFKPYAKITKARINKLNEAELAQYYKIQTEITKVIE